jgi:DNA-binding CsgD family transcriptional regulator
MIFQYCNDRRLREEQQVPAGPGATMDKLINASDVEFLESGTIVRARLVALERTCKYELLSAVSHARHTVADIGYTRRLDTRSLRRGLHMKTLYSHRIHGNAVGARYLEELGRPANSEVRVTTDIPMQLLVVDRRIAIVPVDPGKPCNGALVVHTTPLVTALVSLFERAWGSAIPSRGGADQIDAVERAILRCLRAGHTDASAARRLGISARTVRRHVGGMMERTGARSRFDLGARAAALGWLTRAADGDD